MRKFRMVVAALVAAAVTAVAAPAAHATTEAQAAATFRSYARGYCGNGTGFCYQMGDAYCAKIGVYTFSCATNWIETKATPFSFRTQAASGQVFQGWVSSFNYWTTSG